MTGLFGIVSKEECAKTLFFGVDYHSHLGTQWGGMFTLRPDGIFDRRNESIETAQFKSVFHSEVRHLRGRSGIGAISDSDRQPLISEGRFQDGYQHYAITTSGRITNVGELADALCAEYDLPSEELFFEKRRDGHNEVEVVSKMINQGSTIPEGIVNMHDMIDGSCSLLLLTREGLYAARDKHGKTPLVVGKRGDDWAVSSETCAFPNLKFDTYKFLEPGEIVLIDDKGVSTVKEGVPEDLNICRFLWIYTGNIASYYEGINVAEVKLNCGGLLAEKDADLNVEIVTGIPDSGTGHAIGYVNRRVEMAQEQSLVSFEDYVVKFVMENMDRLKQEGTVNDEMVRALLKKDYGALEEIMARPPMFAEPSIKYRDGYARSYTPPDQEKRDEVALMKQIPIGAILAEGWNELTREKVRGRSVVICEDSIVRNTQLRNLIEKLWSYGVGEIHARVACPPLTSPCPYLVATKKQEELAARRAIWEIEGSHIEDISEYTDPTTAKYEQMVDIIRRDLNVSTLKYLSRDENVKAIGLPAESSCDVCWK
ncbi:amidophosphoribosyltransferase [Nanoarchaeota archaeon]